MKAPVEAAHLPPSVHHVQVFGTTHLFDIALRHTLGKCVLECHVTNCTSCETHVLALIGDWLARKAMLVCDGVAKISAPPTLAQDQYYVDVPPRIDLALVVVLCMALDDGPESPTLNKNDVSSQPGDGIR
ncbi:Aste57867_9905 [Aphanomyces stellatus]|uniref:Aste57867_9905 protein n=1 Tax=Aphanomyces stellatus TaxID=120398 RepID=A0A485KP37_9STRA|nr:hypothetical protein As57867_009866 [Aphanomyces stellatus]VFT86784.1 Aste57867_9905 [Aphanomyces stellatus]